MYVDVTLCFCNVYVAILRNCYVILWSHIGVYATLVINITQTLHVRHMDVRMYTLRYIYVIWMLELGWDYVDLMSYYYFFYQMYQFIYV